MNQHIARQLLEEISRVASRVGSVVSDPTASQVIDGMFNAIAYTIINSSSVESEIPQPISLVERWSGSLPTVSPNSVQGPLGQAVTQAKQAAGNDAKHRQAAQLEVIKAKAQQSQAVALPRLPIFNGGMPLLAGRSADDFQIFSVEEYGQTCAGCGSSIYEGHPEDKNVEHINGFKAYRVCDGNIVYG